MAWYLKKNSGDVYGPVDLPTLQLWATDGRVAADDQVSEDRQAWQPAPNLSDLAMDWNVQLQDGSFYGPVHVLALRDLLADASVTRTAGLTHKISGEKSTVSEALLPVLMEQNSRMQAMIDSLNARLDQAARPAPAAPAEPAAAALDPEKEDLRRQVDALVAEGSRLLEQVEQLKGACEAEKAARQAAEQRAQAAAGDPRAAQAAAGESQALRDEIQKLKTILDTERKAAMEREQDLKARLGVAQAARDQSGATQQDVEKWRKLCEEQQVAARSLESHLKERTATLEDVTRKHDEILEKAKQIKQAYDEEHAAMEAEKARFRQAQDQLRPENFVPRSEVAELERKLAQVERNYQALLRNVNRNLNPGAGGTHSGTAPDQLRRRDVS